MALTANTSLPSARYRALDKEYFKILKKSLSSARSRALGKEGEVNRPSGLFFLSSLTLTLSHSRRRRLIPRAAPPPRLHASPCVATFSHSRVPPSCRASPSRRAPRRLPRALPPPHPAVSLARRRLPARARLLGHLPRHRPANHVASTTAAGTS
jgi:hypothetical protein